MWSINARIKTDAEYCTHLAVNFGRNAEIGQGENYHQEAGQARNGVDLSKGEIQTRETQSKALIVTYPYRPSIALMSSENIPLVVKIGEELPAASWKMIEYVIFFQ